MPLPRRDPAEPHRIERSSSDIALPLQIDSGQNSQESVIRVRFGPPWQQALWLLIFLRLGLELAGFIWARMTHPLLPGGILGSVVIHGGPATELLSIWQRWDGLWYQQIADQGYHAQDNSVHFQPLLPLLSRIVSVPLAGQTVVAELIVTSTAFLGAMWMLYRLARLDVDPATARLTMLLVAFFPTGFFLLAPYTESLYLLVTVAALWFARRGQPWAAGLAGLAGSLSRTIGLLLVIPLAVEYVRQRHAAGKRPSWGLLAATLPAVGYVALTWYQRYAVGELRSPVQVAAHFGDRAVLPWSSLTDSVNFIAAVGDPMETLNLAIMLLFGLLAVYVWRWLPLVYSAYVVPYVLLLLCKESSGSPLSGVSRYMLVLFPCFIALALILRERWQVAAGWLVVGGMLQVGLFLLYVNDSFVA